MKRLLTIVFLIGVLTFGLFTGPASADAGRYRRVADGVLAMQSVKDVESLTGSYCITGIERITGSSMPYLVWAVPKAHEACDGVPTWPSDIPEIANATGISHLGGGLFLVQDVDTDLPLMFKHYHVLDTEDTWKGLFVVAHVK